MDPLAAYWNALAVRRNAKVPYWWVHPHEATQLTEPALGWLPDLTARTGRTEVGHNGVGPDGHATEEDR